PHPARAHTMPLAEGKWGEEQVTIDPEMAEPPADKRKVIDSDNAAIIAGLKGHGPPLFHGAFAVPGSGARTSTFGAWRTLNGGYRSRHLGGDYAARKGAAGKAIKGGEGTGGRAGVV